MGLVAYSIGAYWPTVVATGAEYSTVLPIDSCGTTVACDEPGQTRRPLMIWHCPVDCAG